MLHQSIPVPPVQFPGATPSLPAVSVPARTSAPLGMSVPSALSVSSELPPDNREPQNLRPSTTRRPDAILTSSRNTRWIVARRAADVSRRTQRAVRPTVSPASDALGVGPEALPVARFERPNPGMQLSKRLCHAGCWAPPNARAGPRYLASRATARAAGAPARACGAGRALQLTPKPFGPSKEKVSRTTFSRALERRLHRLVPHACPHGPPAPPQTYAARREHFPAVAGPPPVVGGAYSVLAGRGLVRSDALGDESHPGVRSDARGGPKRDASAAFSDARCPRPAFRTPRTESVPGGHQPP